MLLLLHRAIRLLFASGSMLNVPTGTAENWHCSSEMVLPLWTFDMLSGVSSLLCRQPLVRQAPFMRMHSVGMNILWKVQGMQLVVGVAGHA
jgi:hypothetical protein